MRIESFIRGRSIGSEEVYDAFVTYLACMAKADGYDCSEGMEKIFPELLRNNLTTWVESIIAHHQINIAELDGSRILDQYVVTEDWK